MANTGVGKSNLMLQAVNHQLQLGIPILYVTLSDLEGEDIYSRLVRMRTGLRGDRQPYDPEELGAWEQARDELQHAELRIHDVTQHRELREVHTLCNWIRENYKGYGCIYIDYAQKLKANGVRAGGDQIAEACAYALSWLCKEIRVPIVVGSQVTKSEDGEADGVVTKGGRVWKDESGLAILLERVPQKQKDKLEHPFNSIKDLGILRVSKNRFGMDNEEIMVTFDRKHLRWEEL
jgi:predicted ATP-dependent serine protease